MSVLGKRKAPPDLTKSKKRIHCSFDQLHVLVLNKICKFLYPRDIVTLSFVNKKCYNLLNDCFVYTNGYREINTCWSHEIEEYKNRVKYLEDYVIELQRRNAKLEKELNEINNKQASQGTLDPSNGYALLSDSRSEENQDETMCSDDEKCIIEQKKESSVLEEEKSQTIENKPLSNEIEENKKEDQQMIVDDTKSTFEESISYNAKDTENYSSNVEHFDKIEIIDLNSAPPENNFDNINTNESNKQSSKTIEDLEIVSDYIEEYHKIKKHELEKLNEYISYYEGLMLQFEHFSLTLSKPKWIIHLNNKKYKFDCNRPLLTGIQFLKILRYFKTKQHLIKASNMMGLREVFYKLNPQKTCMLSSKDQAIKFVKEINKILTIGNLKKLVGNYIISNLEHFEKSEIEEMKDIGVELFLGELDEATEEVALAPEMFQCGKLDYPFIEIIDYCVHSLFTPKLVFNDGTFFGESKDEIPNGEGTWISNCHRYRYNGFWKDGQRHGEGRFITPEYIYTGEWSEDLYDGKGTLEYFIGEKRGYRYKGKFMKGMRHGTGIQYFSANAWYRGHWKDDKMHGEGEYRDYETWQFGTFRNGLFYEGVGQIVDEKKNRYHITVSQYKEVSRKSTMPQQIPEEETSGIESIKAPKRVPWNGYYFRSRLEARWAIFFEYLHLDYLYECKTFKLSNGTSYTPDFYIPTMNLWIEIKPMYPTEAEREKARLLAQQLQGRFQVLLLYGSCNPPFIQKFVEGAKGILFGAIHEIEPVTWCQCNYCKQLCIGLRAQPTCHPGANKNCVKPSILLETAYDYVNKIQFEALNTPELITDAKGEYENCKSKSVIVKSKYFGSK